LISAHQNDLKTSKNINLKQRKKNFKAQKQIVFYEIQLQKHVKIAFQTQFFSGSHSIKHSFNNYQTSYCVFCTANTKAGARQTQSKI
jgi:hypothetical protein